jgi:hypothetical protein
VVSNDCTVFGPGSGPTIAGLTTGIQAAEDIAVAIPRGVVKSKRRLDPKQSLKPASIDVGFFVDNLPRLVDNSTRECPALLPDRA